MKTNKPSSIPLSNALCCVVLCCIVVALSSLFIK